MASVLLCGFVQSGGCQLLQEEKHPEKLLLDVILHVSNTYFPKKLPLAILTLDMIIREQLPQEFQLNQSGQSLISSVFESIEWPILTLGYRTTRSITELPRNRPASVILFLNTKTYAQQLNLAFVMLWILTFASWDPRAKVVIVPTNSNGRSDPLEFIFKIAAYYRSYNLIVLVSGPYGKSIDAISWFPYSRIHCDQDTVITMWMDRFIRSGDSIAADKKVDLFPSKYRNDFNKCSVAFHTLPWPPLTMQAGNGVLDYHEGLEIRILNTVAENANFRVVFQENVSNSEAQFGATWITTITLNILDCTWTHYRGSVTWFVPRERQIPQWQSLILIFDLHIWLLVLSAFVFSCMTFWLIANSTLHKDRSSYSKGIIVLYTLSMILCQSVHEKPKAAVSQMFFVIWIYFCLLINNAYQSSLIGFLANPGYLPPIKNMVDLVDSGINLGIQSTIEILFEEYESSPQIDNILSSYISCEEKDLKYCLDRLSYDNDLALMGGRTGIEFRGYVDYSYNGRPLFVPFRENVQEGYMTFVFVKGHLLVRRFSQIVMRLQSAGLIDHWVEEIRRKYGRHYNNNGLRKRGFYVLTMSHVNGAFYLLLIGQVLSLVCFAAEVITCVCKNIILNNRQKRNVHGISHLFT